MITPITLISLAILNHNINFDYSHPCWQRLIDNAFSASYLFVFSILLIICLFLSYILEKLMQSDTQIKIISTVADSAHEAIVITDRYTHITYVNKAYEVTTGYSYQDVIGKKVNLFRLSQQNIQFIRGMWNSLYTTNSWEGVIWDRKKNGQLYIKQLKVVKIKNNNKTERYIGIFNDISMSGVSFKDNTLSHLTPPQEKNNIAPQIKIIDLLGQITISSDDKIVVIYLAIDNFDRILTVLNNNDYQVCNIFTSIIRPFIHKNDIIAQTGRNLFTIIINLNQKEQTNKFVTDLHKKISTIINIEDKDIFFKTRIGVASCWANHNDEIKNQNIKKLLSNAMIALEWEDQHEKKDIAFFNKSMSWELNQENQIEGLLKKAIQNKELSMVYQPQIHIETKKIVGMEALIRWHSPELGDVSPAIFIPIAEKNGQIIEIGNWILHQVCIDLGYIKHQKNCPRYLKCAVNISAIQIEQENFIPYFFKCLDTHHIQSHEIEFEITETSLLRNKKYSINILNAVRQRGISVAIDDFGTGYSSLSYLNTLPIDKIKIDRSFIKNYPEHDNGLLVKILVDMSKTLNKKVLTEGAETPEQIRYLREIGCKYIQGFYYSKPLPLNELIVYAQNHK